MGHRRGFLQAPLLERDLELESEIPSHIVDAEVIDIEAQEYAKGFYEQVGFRQSSEPFILDGIPHIKMTWKESN